MPHTLASALIVGVLAASFACRRMGMAPLQIPRATVFLLMGWLVLPLVTLFVVSRVTAFKIFASTPVLIRVGLIEAARIPSALSLNNDSPLLCPLSKYPIPRRIFLIPHRLDRESEHYMQEISSQILAPNDTFVVVARKNEDFSPWMRGWFPGQGFKASEVGHAEGVPVLLYRRMHQ